MGWFIPSNANYILKNIIPNYHFLNPVKNYKKYAAFNLIPDKQIIHLKKGSYINTTGVILKFNGKTPVDIFTLQKSVSILTRYLRHYSKQFEIDTKKVGMNIFYRDKIISDGKPIKIFDQGAVMDSKFLETRISRSDIIKASKSIQNKQEIPIHFDLFDESISDLKNGNYLKSILLSAISMESFLNSRFDKIHEQKKQSLSGYHEKNKKDYVYERIKNKTSPFENLMREIPLYLKDNVVIADHDTLFRDLKKLYSTRNKIVHWGGPDTSTDKYDDHFLRLDHKGAYEGAKLVNKMFELYKIMDYTKIFQNSTYKKF